MSREQPQKELGRILVVDDTPANVQVLMELLTENGFTTHPATEGELALRFARSTPPDLILLDIMMPGMDGFQVCEQLKADEHTRDIPVIFMTALNDIKDRMAGFKLGAVDFITKPFQAEEALARVHTHMALRTMQKRLEEQNQQLQREITQRRRMEDALQADIRRRKQMERELRESEEKYRSMMEAMDDAVYICSEEYRITYLNPAMIKRIGYDAVGEPCSKAIHGRDEKCPWCVHQRVMKGEHVKSEIVSPKDNKSFLVSSSPVSHLDGSISKLTIFRDDTEIKKIEAQLRQVQKLESVGRLAGGVAHDYNNALGVIIGFAEVAMDNVGPDHPLRDHLDEILKAAHNTVDITRQLLTFAKKQVVAPRIINVNRCVEKMLKMLRRLIGEDIDLAWAPGSDLWPIMVDPSQVNQILVNLCVNSRDAIKGVGKITIETQNTHFDEDRCADHAGFTPGDFIRLAVSDNGCGIERELVENIFEPFFTTKNVDKGTGLGLSTVYGIVKQNKGFINVYTEPDRGTTISIYLPRHEGKLADTREKKPEDMPTGRGETILLVEDDPPFLKLTRNILQSLGYNLLTADTPTEALRLAKEYADKIQLLITDVVLPEMDGPELSEIILSIRPEIRRMFISGYPADAIIHRVMLDQSVRLLQKPFPKGDLAAAVRMTLDE